MRRWRAWRTRRVSTGCTRVPWPTTDGASTASRGAALAAGRVEVAAHHAARYAELIGADPDTFADWDRAFCAEILARVAAATGAPDAADRKAAARALAEAVVEDGERAAVLDRFDREPWFGA